MNTIDNGILSAPARYGQHVSSDVEFAYERDRLERVQRWEDDFDNVVLEIGEQLFSAVRHGDPLLIGNVILAARKAILNRRAERACDRDPDDRPDLFPEPEDAAMRVLLLASIRREGREGT